MGVVRHTMLLSPQSSTGIDEWDSLLIALGILWAITICKRD